MTTIKPSANDNGVERRRMARRTNSKQRNQVRWEPQHSGRRASDGLRYPR